MPTASPPGRTVTVNDTQIYFEVRGEGDPLLLLHGFTGSSQDWLPSLPAWGNGFQFIIPDLRCHGRSTNPAKIFRHDQAATDVIGLLSHLSIDSFSGVGISAGGNLLLHLATRQPQRVKAMVLVSATPYFPDQARAIMRQYPASVTPEQWELLKHRHPGGEAQIQSLLNSTASFADSYDDLNFSASSLATIQARTLIVQGDRDPLYPIELSVEMLRGIPKSSLWVVPNTGHGPVLGERWPSFIQTASQFLQEQSR